MTSRSERRHQEATPKHDGNQGRCPAAQAFPDETPGAGAAPSLVTAVTPATSRPHVQRFGPSARQTMAGRRTGRAFHSNTLGTLRGLGPTGVQGRPSSALQTRRRHLAPSSAMSDPGRKLGGCPGSQGPPGEGRSQSLTPAPSRPSRDHTVSFLLLAAGLPRVRAGPAGLPAASACPTQAGPHLPSGTWPRTAARPRPSCPLPCPEGHGGPRRLRHGPGGLDLRCSLPSKTKPETGFHHSSPGKIP